MKFNLGEVLVAVISQGMILSRERQVRLLHDWPSEVSYIYLYGDNLRLQQVLADFLLNAMQFSQPSDGPVMFKVISRKRPIGTDVQVISLDFRYIFCSQISFL